MSRATKRKHVTREVLDELVEPTDSQEIVKIECGCGNNLHKVLNSTGRQFLVSMPTKFRRNVWIKRGDYVVVESIAEGQKVQAEIVYILYPRQIKHLKKENKWPTGFSNGVDADRCPPVVPKYSTTKPDIVNNGGEQDEQEYCSSEDDSDLFVNTNRSYDCCSSSDIDSDD